jgi:hypothetical protein
MTRTLTLVASCAVAALAAPQAHAQSDSLLIPASLPDDFDRGGNVSVAERPRPDYDPLGIPVGSLTVFPSVQAGVGYSDNVFLTDDDQRGDVYAYVAPSVRAISDWSRHAVQLRASAQLRRFAEETLRNETTYSLGALGRYDLGTAYSVTGEAQYAKLFESPLSGEIDADGTALSRYRRALFALRGEYHVGQVRAIAAVDHTTLDFQPIRFPNGTTRSQQDRDRTIDRVTGQLQYALTPSAAVYGQVSYGETDYWRALSPGVPNRDSHGVRVLGGLNLDLAGFLRGIIGVGYVWRNYEANRYRDVDGLSVEAKLEYFLSPLTTFTLSGRRVIEDSSLGASEAFFDNRLSLRADHELLRNLILNAQVDYAHQDYIGSSRNSDVYRFSGGARYFSSNRLGLDFQLSYGGRETGGTGLRQPFNEFRVQAGIVLQR